MSMSSDESKTKELLVKVLQAMQHTPFNRSLLLKAQGYVSAHGAEAGLKFMLSQAQITQAKRDSRSANRQRHADRQAAQQAEEEIRHVASLYE
jgi:hypothetical protein